MVNQPEPTVWEVVVIAFTIFGTITVIIVFSVLYITASRRRPRKMPRLRQQLLVENHNCGDAPILMPNSSSQLGAQATDTGTNVNANTSMNCRPQVHGHRRHLVYYLDGSTPFIGPQVMLRGPPRRQPVLETSSSASSSSSFSFDSDSLTFSPSQPAIFGVVQDEAEIPSVKVKFTLTPPTPAKGDGPNGGGTINNDSKGAQRERRTSEVISWDDSS